MKIVVMGAGGVGGYFGGLLARVGEDVTFIARGDHLNAIKRDGLRVVSDLSGEFTTSVGATNDTASLGFVDLVIFTVKMYHNEGAIPVVAPLVGPDTIVLTLQNGIDNANQLCAAFGTEKVMIGSAFIQARIREPGVIEQVGQVGRVAFGEIDPTITARAKTLLDLFTHGGWNVELSENALGVVWRKFIYLCGTAGVNAATQIPFGEMRSIPETRQLISDAYQEIINVGIASGAPLGDGVLEWAMGELDGFPAGGMTSLAKDFMAGNRVELDGLTGAAVRLGRELGVPTPVNSTLYALLKPSAMKIEASSG